MPVKPAAIQSAPATAQSVATQTVMLRIRGEVGGQPLTPATLDLAALRKLLSDVERLVLAGRKKVQPPVALVGYTSHVLELALQVPTDVADAFADDMQRLLSEGRLDGLRYPRACVLAAWQKHATENPAWQYEIYTGGLKQLVKINSFTNYTFRESWFDVEVYLYGVISRMGGAARGSANGTKQSSGMARVHIRDERLGMKVLRCRRQVLEAERMNRLYKYAGVHVRGRQHALTGKLDRLELVAFVDALPHYEPMMLEESIRRAGKLLRKAPRTWPRTKGVLLGTHTSADTATINTEAQPRSHASSHVGTPVSLL